MDKALETVVMLNAEALLASNPVAFYEFVMLCRNPGHVMWGNTREVAYAQALVDENGIVHDQVRDIIMDRVTGDGLDMRIV